MYAQDLAPRESTLGASASVTAGLKCAPEIGPKREDECDERRARRERVGEKREGHVSARETLTHDA